MQQPVEANEYDDRTLLDTFGEISKQFLTQKIIPPTDKECKWDWRFVRCEPFCQCDFQFQAGDYHLGRSCRLQQKENCDPAPEAKPIQLMIQRMVQGSQKVAQKVGHKTKTGYAKVQSNVCTRIPELPCSEEPPVLAWQERLLCRSLLPDCSEGNEENQDTQ